MSKNTNSEFHDFKNNFTFKPIFGCKGRYIFHFSPTPKSLTELFKIDSSRIKIFNPESVPDQVLIVFFSDGGGFISYLKRNGSYIHTLNDDFGFKKKLKKLAIELID